MKFSIIVPVYNAEKYLRKCLNSIKNQTYPNFEVIIVNDGSPDNSQSIIDEFVATDNRFNSYIKENGGLSDARNYGLKYVTGDYICFLDCDDYYDEELLSELNKIGSSYDMIKFKVKLVDIDGNLIRLEKDLIQSGEIDFKQLRDLEFLEPTWLYAYKTSFFKQNKFKYEVNRLPEDYGLTPFCLLKANRIYYLNYYGYNYVQRQKSMIKTINASKRIDDLLFHFDNLIKKVDKEKNISEKNIQIFKSMLAERLIYCLKYLSKDYINKYLIEIKKRNVSNYLLGDSITKYIKKKLFYYCPKLYLFLLKIITKNK